MNKQIVVCPSKELLSLKKEWTTDTQNNMVKPHTHYAEWKKPYQKMYTLYGSII